MNNDYNFNQHDDDSEDSRAKRILKKIRERQDENDYTPKIQAQSARDVLTQLQSRGLDDEFDITGHPIFKEAYSMGYEQGTEDTEIRLQKIVSAIVRLYDGCE